METKLILTDWSEYIWESFWYESSTTWEVVFNTWMFWYPESLTDPSYKWQILVLTYPLIWNYWIPDFTELDKYNLKKYFESDKIHLQALIVSEYSQNYNHFEASESLGDFLKSQKIPAITWIDTRSLTKKLREHWVMLGKIIIWKEDKKLDFTDPNKKNLCEEVSRKKIEIYWNWKKTICLLDMWVKNNILRSLLKLDSKVIVIPSNYPFMDWSIDFDGLFISNWPWDPEKNTIAINEIKKAIKANKKIFWICLWNQLLALASWAKTYKLKYWHRWQNQACKDLETWKCVITSFININDNTNEWIKFKNKNIRSVQFCPERGNYLFKDFVESL